MNDKDMTGTPDDEIVGYETAIMDGIGPNVGLQRVPITRGERRRRVAVNLTEEVWAFLMLGGTADDLRHIIEQAISGAAGNAGPALPADQ